uniref:Uncharacterized protein n=1 Tax=Zonotrichia albicollis TaxID=44394 RepID=A0A8D2M8X2_ZONAL
LFLRIHNTGKPHLGMHLITNKVLPTSSLPLWLYLGLPKGDAACFPFRTEYNSLHTAHHQVVLSSLFPEWLWLKPEDCFLYPVKLIC